MVKVAIANHLPLQYIARFHPGIKKLWYIRPFFGGLALNGGFGWEKKLPDNCDGNYPAACFVASRNRLRS
jgi:hypothetical protein